MNSHDMQNIPPLGMLKEEYTIYTTLLKHNKLSITDISRSSGIKRSTCYEYIDKLLKNDFIVRLPFGKRTLYSAGNPKIVLKNAKENFQKFEKQVETLEKIYDETNNKPKVAFYEGKREIKKIYNEVFEAVGDAYSIFPPKAFFENFTIEDYSDFDCMITNSKFKSKDLVIFDDNFKKLEKIRKKNGNENKLSKKLPDSFKTNVDVLITGNTVALISLKDLTGIVIENHDISELFKSMHNYIWKYS